MKNTLLYIFFALLPFLGQAQDEAAAYAVSDEYNLWMLSPGDTAITFADNAYIRTQPNLTAPVTDSVTVGTRLIIKSPAYGGNKIKGFYAPWHEIAYQKDGETKKGFIWLGLLALKKQADRQGNLYLYGLDRFIADKEEQPDRYLCTVKRIDAASNTVARQQITVDYAGQTYTECKLLPDMGLAGLQQIFRLAFIGEACGIPSQYYYVGWDGSQFIQMPGRYTVSDAGIYYYQETILFPSEHKKEANLVYKLIEEGEAEDEQEEMAELNYKINKRQERFLWEAGKFTAVPVSK